MTGKYTPKDPVRCFHYARFMAKLSLAEAEAIFWLLFILVLLLMCVSSFYHHKSTDLAEQEKRLPTAQVSTAQWRARVKRLRTHYLSVVTLCLVIGTTCVFFEAFAAFNIEYCYGEDLMQLYWGFWSILQVGSLIAILGVMVQFWIILGNHETPSWAVALGTPVLVFAALGWLMHKIGGRAWASLRGRKSEDEDDDMDEEKGNMSVFMSRAPTIVVPENCQSPDRSGVRDHRPSRPWDRYYIASSS